MKINISIDIVLYSIIILTGFVTINKGFSDKIRNESSKDLQNTVNSINLINFPKFLTANCQFNVTYTCSNHSYIHLSLEVEGLGLRDIKLLKRTFACKANNTVYTRLVSVHLPKHLAYKPSFNNNYNHYIETAILRLWMVPSNHKGWMYGFTDTNVQVLWSLPEPFDRPDLPYMQSDVWWKKLSNMKWYAPMCSLEKESIRILSYPMALSGERVGLVKKMEPYHDLFLQKQYKKEMENSSFSLIMWMYVKEYCPKSTLCSIMHHITWDDKYNTPLLLINRKGQLHIEVFMKEGTTMAYLSHSSLPKNKWILLLLTSQGSKKLQVDVKYEPAYKAQVLFQLSLPKRLFFKDTTGNLVFGGSDMLPSFMGYFGDIVLHRRRLVSIDQISIPSMKHPMFELKLHEKDSSCEVYQNKVSLYWKHVQEDLKEKKTMKKMCKRPVQEFDQIFHRPPQCPLFSSSFFRQQFPFVSKYINKRVSNGDSRLNNDISLSLLQEVYSLIEKKGLPEIRKIIRLLKQSRCYGNQDSTYMLATIFNYGLTVPVDEIRGHSYLLRSCLSLDRMSLLSMANKHTLGIDGIPLDYDQAYVYYMTAAIHTIQDLERHRDKDTLTELVRLTDEVKVEEHEGEDGHLFQWFRQQAARGVVGAQQKMASLLYWGAKGVKRNVTSASTYYKQAATTGNANSVHDYAIILLKGQGVKKNITKALELLMEGASKNYTRSCNTLGWYYLVHAKNYTLAAEYLEKAFYLGDPDAGHNIAHMLLTAKYPGVPRVERRMAWEFISKAAMRGNKESSVLVAKYNMQGHASIIRDPELSVLWARYLSEKNPAIGKFLKMGVSAYRLKNWEASLLYYLMAANSGTEVASFNLAFLCDENHEYLSSNMGKECAYRHFNFSSLRSKKKENSYARLKLADFFYQQDNITLATSTYAEAALNGDPQGLFNLALLVEEDRKIKDEVWKSLNIPFNTSRHKLSLLHHIYSRCRDSKRNDAYLPCVLALARINVVWIWMHYQTCILSWLIGGMVIMFTFTFTRLRRQTRSLLENEI